MIRKLVALLMVACFAGLAGCNTMQGFGQDVKKGGEKIEDSAEKHK